MSFATSEMNDDASDNGADNNNCDAIKLAAGKALSINTEDLEGTDFTVSTPTGSTEILTRSSSVGASDSDQENHNNSNTSSQEEAAEKDNRAIPVDLAALKLSRTSIRERKLATMPRRMKLATAASSTNANAATAPLIENNISATSPRLNLPLPPETSKSNSGTPSSASAKATYLTRKAQRYSNMKKKKGNTQTLLNRLFCNSPMSLSSNCHDDEFAERLEPSLSMDSSPVYGTQTGDENEPTCSEYSKQLLDQASESLTLHDEAKVRDSIQRQLPEALMACSTPHQSSPPTTQIPSFQDNNSNTSTTDESTVVSNSQDSLEVKLFGDAAVGVSSSKKSSVRKTKNKSSQDEDSIKEPSTKISMFSADDDIAETASQPKAGKSPKREKASKGKSNDDEGKTPAIANNGNPIKTPGGLVIPSPFTHYGKGIFPVTLEKFYGKSSSNKNENQTSPKPEIRFRSSSISPHRSPISNKISQKEKKSDIPKSSKGPSHIELERPNLTMSSSSEPDLDLESGRVSPPPMVRLASSNADLSTVPEVSESKEAGVFSIDSNDSTIQHGKHGRSPVPSDERSVGDRVDSTLEAAREEMRNELLREQEMQLKEAMSSSSSSLFAMPDIFQQQRDQMRREIESELKSQYERKLNEQKDKTALAKRLAQQRMEEIERLELVMDEMKDSQVDESELVRLQHRLAQMQQERKKEIDRVRKETEARIKEKVKEKELEMEHEISEMKKHFVDSNTKRHSPSRLQQAELQKAKRDILELRSKLETKEKELSDYEAKVHEVDRLSAELESVKKALSCERASSSNYAIESSKSEIEKKNIKDELEKVRETLALKERELDDVTKKLDSYVTVEVYEEEKDASTRKIAQLEQQLLESSKQHKQAVEEMKTAHDLEVNAVKKDMQDKLKQFSDQEKSLKDTLSETYSREKKDLLKKIDQLEAERKNEQSYKLQEVQQKEELLKRIEKLEEREKELAKASLEKEDLMKMNEQLKAEKETEHNDKLQEVQQKEQLQLRIEKLEREKELVKGQEQALNDLKSQKDAEITKLQDELATQKQLQVAREKELEQSFAETKSFEQSKFLQQLESLKAQLDAEQNETSQLKSKIEEMETLMTAAERNHRNEIDKLTLESTTEIERLKKELDEFSALEEAMQITSNEREIVKEEIQKLQNEMEQMNSQHVQKIEELRLKHKEEIAVFEKTMEEQRKRHEEEIANAKTNLEKDAQDRLKKSENEYKEKMVALKNKFGEERKQRLAEINAVENKYKTLLAESNNQFESTQKQLEDRIKVLELELAESDKQHEQITHKLVKENEGLRSTLANCDAEHDKQFEELLGQLDLVEADHKEILVAKDKALSEKEAIVDALGSQLAEARARMKESDEGFTEIKEKYSVATKKCNQLETELDIMKKEVQSLKEMHKKFQKEAAKEKERACKAAREETIEKAEIEFQQANQHYMTLRKQYDESQTRIRKLENDIKLMKRKVEKVTNEKESCEVELKAEIASLHAASAKIEADAAQKAKDHRHEIDRLLSAVKEFEAKAEEAENTSQQVQSTLRTVADEKERLQKEYEEIKAVSEELLAIVEEQQQKTN